MTPGPPSPPSPGDDDGNKVEDEIRKSEEFGEFGDAMSSLRETISSIMEDQRHKKAATLASTPPIEREFAEDILGTILVTPTETVYLPVAYYASARENFDYAAEEFTGEYDAEVVVIALVLSAGDAYYGEVGDTTGWFVGKFESAHTLKGLRNVGVPDPEKYEPYRIITTGPWNVTPEMEQIRDRQQAGEYNHLVVGGFDNRDDAEAAVAEAIESGGLPGE